MLKSIVSLKNLFSKIGRLAFNIRESIYDCFMPADFFHNLTISNDGIANIEIKIDTKTKILMLDIGLSHNAPNSAEFLSKFDDFQVIGVEANKYNVRRLLKFGIWSRNNPNRYVAPFKSCRFSLLFGALDNVSAPTYSNFYNMKGDAGTSSLLKPTNVLYDRFGYKLKKISRVPTISLECMLDAIPWHQFTHILFCKVDTQGKDLDILKSAGSYLEKIAFISVEVSTFGQYEKSFSELELYEFMRKSGFYELKVLAKVDNYPVDVLFVNKNYEHMTDYFLSMLD